MNHSIQITVLDYYIRAPIPGLDILYSDFRASPVHQVPILRCFGSTENGTKICVHIHGVFPYFYIPYNGQENPEDLMQKIAREIDKIINLSLNQANSNIQHVYKISLVSGIPMYGYHVKNHQFLKIYLYNPRLISKIGNLLLNGQILNKIFQPHEIHLNFTLQFMIDYNLHGMNAMLIKSLQFRKDQHNLLLNNDDDDMRNFLTLEKQSYCELEADVNAENILNRADILSGNLTVNPGIAALWEDEKQRRRNQNQNSQLGDFLELKNLETVPTKSHIIFQQALNERLLVASSMDKDTSKNVQNSSIYPAESPNELNIQNASLLDIHCPSSLELSLDETLTQFYSQQNSGEDVTMNEDALKLVGILEQLAEENALEENDGILTQTVVAEEEEDVDLVDLSLPLALFATPTKNFPSETEVLEDVDILNTTLIPQIDGIYDSSDEDDDVPLINLQQKMLCESFCVQLVLMDLKATQLLLNKSIGKVMAEDKGNDKMMKRATWRVKRLFSKYTIHKHIKRRIIKEKYLMDFLNHTKPKIGIHSRKKDFHVTHHHSTFDETILNYIIRLTNYYTDPNLYITIKIESDTYFWHYGGKSVPKVLQNSLANNKMNFGNLNELSSELNCSAKAILLKKIHKILWLDDHFIFRNRKKINKNELVIKIEDNDNNREKNEQISELDEFFDIETLHGFPLKINNNLRKDVREKWAFASLDMPEISFNADTEDLSTTDTISIQKENCSHVHSFAELTLNEQSMENVTKIRIDKNAWALLLALEEFTEKNVLVERKLLQNKIQDVNGNLSSNMDQKKDNDNNDSLNITLTSQLDGLDDFSDSEEDAALSTASRNFLKIMLCEPFSIEIIQEDLQVLKIREQLKLLNRKTDREMLRLATFRAKRLFIKYAIDEFVNQRRSKDLILMNFLNHSKPKLGFFSSKRDFLGLDINKPYFNCDGIVDSSSDDDDEENNSSLAFSGLGLNVDTLSENMQQKQPELKQLTNPKLIPKPHKRQLFICDNYATKESLNLDNSSSFNAKNDELECSSDSDLFSSSDNEMLDFKSLQHLSISKIYDYTNNYYPTQGCSKEDVNLIVKIKPVNKAPTRFQIEFTMSKYKIPKIIQQEPFYGNVEDYTGTVEVGQRIMRIGTRTTAHLQEFESQIKGIEDYRKDFIKAESNLSWNVNNIKHLELAYCPNKTVIICPLKRAPRRKEVLKWIKSSPGTITEERIMNNSSPKKGLIAIHIPNSPDESDLSETSLTLTPCVIPHHSDDANNKSCLISGISHGNSFGFDNSVQNLQAARTVSGQCNLISMVMELHIRTRGDLRPNPLHDSICAVFYSVLHEANIIKGVIAINTLPSDAGHRRNDFFNGLGKINIDITYVSNEEILINSLILIIRKWDPDILAGYEIEMLSWGYLIERASILSINLTPLLGRWKNKPNNKQQLQSKDLETSIIGRIVINVWRIMRHEIALQSYTLESIVYNILHRRIPYYDFKDLTFWWDHRTTLYRHRTVRYYVQRVEIILELFNKLDFLNRTSELAKLFGILFYEVLSRGSQFRVESMMLRLAKPLNYVPVSPDTKQRAQMKAPEFIPLVMEPESKFYTDPIIVLDFQSLYPSIIIAYNYCFTTCIGRVKNLGSNNPFEFGATQLKVPKRLVEKLYKKNLLNYSPCGVAFVKQKVREGILPRMLKEILGTRLMVKDSMKENKHDGNLQKVLHNRQLGLKLIANVTYGYTAANFSGRMCCVEVGDSVVSKGRETLQRAISMVENTKEWEAKVVYGDTDSLFVLVPGKSKEEAFEIGKKIAAAVTADNPDPVKLKLEKVYQPCILQTKKRYVGYKYESSEEQIPVYEAKGIETVRRDGCPAVSKMLLQCLTLLFNTRDVSLVKNYVLKQFNKIQKGRVSIQDLTFAKEYRGLGGYKPGACVPALELARKWKLIDPRSEPRSGERVPYVIINGPPGLPLIRLVRSPKELLKNTALRPNALYYITKVIIPPINRCFNLIGADLNNWFNQMPRIVQHHLPNSSPSNPIRKTIISQYFVTRMCAACSNQILDEGLCEKCHSKPNCTALTLTEKLKLWEENYFNALLLCQSCSDDSGQQISCFSLDCPVLYRRIQTFNDLQQSAYVRDLLNSINVFEDD